MTIELSKKAATLQPSATLALSARVQELKKQGIDVVGFGAGEPDFEVPEIAKKAVQEALNIQGTGKYTAVAGITELKQSIQKKFKQDNNLSYDLNQIIISPGAKFSLYLIAQVILNPGDEVIIPVPYWLSYPVQTELAGATPVYVDTDNELQLKAEDVEKAITPKTKMIYINSPSNPSGIVYDKEELVKIAELAVKNSIIVISDEIYEKVAYDKKPISIAALDVPGIYDLTLTVNGASKEFAMPGWRLGYAAGPQEVIAKMTAYQSQTTSNPASLVQHAVIAVLEHSEEIIKPFVEEFRERRDYIIERLNSMPNISCVTPEGAFYVFPDISKTGLDSTTFSQRLLDEAYVGVVPGAVFGSDKHVRISYATSMDAIKEGMDRLERWLNNL